MGLWSHMAAPKPNIDVFFEQKTMHLMNEVWDSFQVLGLISNPLLDIGGKSFLNGKDIQLVQPGCQHLWFVTCWNTICTLGGVVIPPIQLLGFLVESFQVQVIDVALIIPLMSAVGRPSRGLA